MSEPWLTRKMHVPVAYCLRRMKEYSPDVSQYQEAVSIFVPLPGLNLEISPQNTIKLKTILLLQCNQYILFYNAQDRKKATAKAQKPPRLLG